jgi:hypothetical protein
MGSPLQSTQCFATSHSTNNIHFTHRQLQHPELLIFSTVCWVIIWYDSYNGQRLFPQNAINLFGLAVET